VRFHALWTELVWLNVKWREFEGLYKPSNEHDTLLEQVAPHFFGTLQQTLREDVLGERQTRGTTA